MSKPIWTEFEDLVAVNIPIELIEAQDSLTSTSRLIVSIDASHAGVLNGNMRMYRPDKVKSGAFSMIDKPFIKHHDETSDPIGVVIDADFVNIASDEFKAVHRNFMSNKFWESDTPYDDIFTLSPQGLGKLVAKAQVTDLDAIEKILDRRFMGVSIKFRTDQMRCSCGKDKASMMSMFGFGPEEDDETTCSCPSGETDAEGVLHFNVAGNLRFPHLSVVNEPADPNAKIITTDCIDMKIYDGTNGEKTYSKYIVDTEGNDEVVDNDINNSLSEKTDFPQEGHDMDRNELLQNSIVKELLEEATTEGKNSRQSEIDELKAESEKTAKILEQSDDALKVALDEVEGLTRTLVDTLAADLVALRASHGEQDYIDNASDMAEKLAKRTISSLRDSLEDERSITIEKTEEEDPVVEEPITKVDDPGVSPEDKTDNDNDISNFRVTKYNSWMV